MAVLAAALLAVLQRTPTTPPICFTVLLREGEKIACSRSPSVELE